MARHEDSSNGKARMRPGVTQKRFRRPRKRFLVRFLHAHNPASQNVSSERCPFPSGLGLLAVELVPLLALFQHKLFGLLEAREDAFPFHQIARPASGHEVVHPARSAVRVGMNVINGQDEPVFKMMSAVQAAVLAFEVVPPEDLHSFIPGHVQGRPEYIPMESF
jgi:hypothetical protein